MLIVVLGIWHFNLDSLAEACLVIHIRQMMILVLDVQDVSVGHQSVVGSHTVGQLDAVHLKVLLMFDEVIVLGSMLNSSFVPQLRGLERLKFMIEVLTVLGNLIWESRSYLGFRKLHFLIGYY